MTGCAAFAVLIYGGYAHHWPWTGIDGKTATLWDWLHLLLLPIAVMIVPIWARRRKDLGMRHKAAGMTIVTAFAAVVLAGYLRPWPWTGFPGNTLWDWLGLLALPLAVALIPVIREVHANWQRRDWLIVLAALLLFLVPVLGGYLGDWAWTGFRGNTLWDWLHLLVLPLLVPTVVIPALKPLATPGPAPSQEPGPAPAEPETAPAPAAPAKEDAAATRAAAARHDPARLRRWAIPAALAAAALAGTAVSVTLAGQAADTPQPALVHSTPRHGTTPGPASRGPAPASPAPAPPARTTGPAQVSPPSHTPAATTPAASTSHATPAAGTPPPAGPSAAPAVPMPGPARHGLPASPAG